MYCFKPTLWKKEIIGEKWNFDILIVTFYASILVQNTSCVTHWERNRSSSVCTLLNDNTNDSNIGYINVQIEICKPLLWANQGHKMGFPVENSTLCFYNRYTFSISKYMMV